MAASSNEKKVTLKLLIDPNGKRVLFAEAGKDFVDFLFYLLQLPVGTVLRLLRKQTMVGSLGDLYESIENLSETFFQSNKAKETVLKPKSLLSATQLPLLSLDGASSAISYYTCSCNFMGSNTYVSSFGHSFHAYVADNARAVCPICQCNLSKKIKYVAADKEVAAAGEGGFVKGLLVSYMVMDDLAVTPMSASAGITMLNKLNVKDVGALKEIVVDFGMPEALNLLKASLNTKKVLTSVFQGHAAAADDQKKRKLDDPFA